MGNTLAKDSESPAFVYVTCQVGAERALKSEIVRLWPRFHFAYSRPGFLTFKLPDGHNLSDDFELKSVFARSYGFSLGKTVATFLDARAAEAWQIAEGQSYDALHVWQRDTAPCKERGFEPHLTPAACEAETAIREQGDRLLGTTAHLTRIARPGQRVLDCILVEPAEWWIGTHRAASGESCFPGGVREISLPSEAVSRAYLKMEEALAWSGLPLAAGQRVVEIGCAPGGASQALLRHGVSVVGIDPAEVDPLVVAHPRFTHVQKRGSDVRRREFRGVTWLTADMNVAPQYTLDTVEAIVTHPTVNIRGLLLTLKLLDWDLAEHIPEYLERIRGWGYAYVRAKQLTHNRQEICVAALRRKPRPEQRAPAKQIQRSTPE